MARNTTRTLAGKAASAARKAVSRRTRAAAATKNGSAKEPAPAKKSVAKNGAPAKKTAPAKKVASAAKGAAKKAAPATKAAAKKAPAKKAPPAKKAAATKAAPAKKAPAKKTASAAKMAAPVAKKQAKKTPAPRKNASPASLAVLPREKPWTKAEVDEVVADLNADRARVIRTLTAQQEELAGLMRDAGDGAGHDTADMGATSFERDQELILLNSERDKLAQIERALLRIADGTYGTCESCGNPIGKGRAMAFPRATLCLTCKQREERR